MADLRQGRLSEACDRIRRNEMDPESPPHIFPLGQRAVVKSSLSRLGAGDQSWLSTEKITASIGAYRADQDRGDLGLKRRERSFQSAT